MQYHTKLGVPNLTAKEQTRRDQGHAAMDELLNSLPVDFTGTASVRLDLKQGGVANRRVTVERCLERPEPTTNEPADRRT